MSNAVNLNAGQFDAVHNYMETNYGFSYKMPTGGRKIGRFAADRYLVGGQAEEGKQLPGETSQGSMQRYATENAAQLGRAERYLGGWQDNEGRTTLDVSKGIPRSPANKLNAVYEGIAHGEDGIGEVDSSGEYVGTHPTAFGMAAAPKGWDSDKYTGPLPPRTAQNQAKRAAR